MQGENCPSSEEQVFKQLGKVNYTGLSSLESVLTDRSTLDIFARAIRDNTHQFANKTVLHLSSECNCFYSLFAAQAGAKKVYCVLNGHNENQHKNAFMMRELIKENGFDHVIQVVLYKQLKISGKVDVIIGEPMGCNLYFDGMLDRIIQARNHFLDKDKGVLFPNKINYKCVLILDEYQKDEKVAFWDEVYGVKMSGMKQWVAQEPIIRVVDPTLIVSQISDLFSIDLYKATYDQIDQIKRTVSLRPIQKEGSKANGFSIWFEAIFTLADGEQLIVDASPWNQQTRWSHATLYTKQQWNLESDKETKITFYAKKNNTGQIKIKLKVSDCEQLYKIV